MKRKFALALMLVLMLLKLVPFEALAQETVDDNIVIASYYSPSVRKNVQALDLLWSFYVDTDSALKFKTSSDNGGNWSSATTVRTGVVTTYSTELSVYVGGSSSNHIHITYSTALTTKCYYRRGTLYADGTITWLAEQLYPFIGVYVQVAADTNGYPWIGGGNDGTGGSNLYITKSSTNDGTWATEAGYAKTLDSQAAGGNPFRGSCIPVPLTDGKLVAIWQYGWSNLATNVIKAQRYDGVNWGSVKTSTLNSFYGYMSVVGQDDDAHIVALERATYDIEYVKYSYSLSDPFTSYTTIYSAATSTSAPAMSMDSANNLHVFWENDPTDDHVYYAMHNYLAGNWTTYYDLVDEIDDLPANGYYLNSDYTCDRENLGVYYIAGTTILKFKLLNEPFVVHTLSASAIGNTYATLRGEIMSLSFGSATDRGFYINTVQDLVGATQVADVPGTYNVGVFTLPKTGLIAGETYYYIAYAENAFGREYALGGTDWITFTTSEGGGGGGGDEVVVETNSATGVTTSQATLQGNITATGTNVVSIEGYEWGLTTAYSDSWVTSVGQPYGVGSIAPHTISGLAPYTQYHFRAKAYGNDTGWAYGGDNNFYTSLNSPVITAKAATYISMSSARLNALLNSDGGEDCDVRFQYYIDGVGNWTNNQTPWVTGYSTGNTPYANIIDLIGNTTYRFRAQALNSVTTVNSNELTFTTALSIGNVTDFIAIPKVAEATIDLKWAKPIGATMVMVRGKLGEYPGNSSEGTLVCEESMNAFAHENLTPGDTWYYAAWGKSGNNTSLGVIYAIATVSLAIGDNTFTNPDMPLNWFSAVDYTKMSALPFYGTINEVTDSFGINKQFMWGTLGFMIALLVFIASYRATQGNVLSALLATTVILAVETGMGLMAGFIVFLFVIMAISLAFVHARA